MSMRLFIALLLFMPVMVYGAFPTVESQSKGSSTGDATPTLIMPATVSADAIIIACMGVRNGTVTLTWNTATYGTWDAVFTEAIASEVRFECHAILADGDEDSGTFDNTLSGAVDAAWFILSVINWENDTVANGVEAGTTATGSSANPDPPSVTPTWGDDDNLYITVVGQDRAATPTVWSLPDNQATETSPHVSFMVSVAVSTDELTGASQNPVAYTMDDSDDWITNTIVIQPAASGLLLRRRR